MSKKTRAQRARERPCRVYWGTHGCKKQRGHSGRHLCQRGCPPFEENLWPFGEDLPDDVTVPRETS